MGDDYECDAENRHIAVITPDISYVTVTRIVASACPTSSTPRTPGILVRSGGEGG